MRIITVHHVTLFTKIIPILEVLMSHHVGLRKIDIRNTGILVMKVKSHPDRIFGGHLTTFGAGKIGHLELKYCMDYVPQEVVFTTLKATSSSKYIMLTTASSTSVNWRLCASFHQVNLNA